ncbi:WD repeat-containing protein 11-like [Uloborus diversus]|uniref:WD repeat-containing protein 11-like n=1 Tax=Uloborus diversus TaxID=327109 RepID=UPI002408FAEB|nr:WD repeat-containing protein 11-like [Uloborus diversus]
MSLKIGEVKKEPVIHRVSPRTIPGVLSAPNKGTIDWGWQSFIAYGCCNHVIIVDTKNIKVFQTLEKHSSDVIKVKWSHENFYHDGNHPYVLKLASADSNGLLIVWEVKEGKPISTFSEPGKPATEIEWLSGRDSSQNFLVALHPPFSFIIWNTDSGTKLWKKSYTETLLSFALDPFSESNVTFLASDCILFVDDLGVNRAPSGNGRKFFISNPLAEDKNKNSSRIIKKMWLLSKPDGRSSEDGITLNECLFLTYHKSYRHHLLLLYPKEVLILDLEINQTVGIVPMEHTSSPMMQFFSCRQRDLFYILHESGSVSLRLRHRPECSESSLEVSYDLQCQSDALRLTKHARVTGMALCPVTEMKAALLLSDGRVLFFKIDAHQQKEEKTFLPLYLAKVLDHTQFPQKLIEKTCFQHPVSTLSDALGPALYPSEKHVQRKETGLNIFVTGLLSALASPPHVIRMCPPVTFRNWNVYKPYMAIGNAGGSIQIINMATGVITKEFALHTSPVRGIEWIGLTSFLSYAHPNTGSSLGQVRNELLLTDLQSGRTNILRADRTEESPIDMIRVSYLRQYMVIVLKEDPFEIWDLKQLTLLRVMPKNYPIVTALEWSPSHKKSQSSLELSFEKNKESSSEFSMERDVMSMKCSSYQKENLVFTDTNGMLYHFSVDGNVVKHGSVIPADQAMGSVSCIAWKGDHIVLGDVDGNLTIWYLKGKVSKGISTHRGWIKKIRFGPGKGNMKILVLYNDGVDVWDVKDASFVSGIRCPRDIPRVQDLDWVGSDRPVLATADGCLRITDLGLKIFSSSAYDYHIQSAPFSPHLLSPRVCFYLKSFLQHLLSEQTEFFSDIDQQDDPDMFRAQVQLRSLDRKTKEFLKGCPYGTAERSLHISRLFGDEEGVIFWTVALHFLKQAKYQSLQYPGQGDGFKPDIYFDHPLDTAYDFFCDSEVYKRLQLDRVHLHLSKRSTYAQTQQCSERLLLLGQTDQAVQLLLETDSENDSFYEDCLRACLLSTVQCCWGQSQSVVKLVATNLIASGRISEGVQLLCLIQKASDGCRYLQGAGRWIQGAWLAKAALSENESREILKRWVDHMCSAAVDQKARGILMLLSLFEFWDVVRILHSTQRVERAALFLQACLEFGLLRKDATNSSDIEAVFMDYSKYLLSVKNRSSAIHYFKLGSDADDQPPPAVEVIS